MKKKLAKCIRSICEAKVTKKLQINKAGFIVYPTKVWLGALPDGWTTEHKPPV